MTPPRDTRRQRGTHRPHARTASASASPVTALVVGLALGALVAACSLTVKTDDLEGGCPTCGDAAPGRDATSLDAALDGSTRDGGTCILAPDADPTTCGACAGGIVYVSTAGSDTYDGCTPGHPKETLQAAINLVQGTGVSQKVEVCAGAYVAASLTVNQPVKLYGGYDCSTWTRTSTYGAPTFDRTHETVLSTPDSGSGATITFATAGVTREALLDGFTITGASFASILGEAYGVFVNSNANPVVSNNIINGPISQVSRTIGVEVVAGGAPEIGFNKVSGGTGQRSIGIDVEYAGSAYIHDNVVDGGASTLDGSYGIYLVQSGPFTGANAVANNVVDGGTPGGDGPKTASFGLDVSASDADILSNTISSGVPVCSTTTCGGRALFVTTASDNHVLVQGNRIYTDATTQDTVALVSNTTGDLRVFDNLIEQSGGQPTDAAVLLGYGNNTVFADNTVYGEHVTLQLGSETKIVVDDNLFLGLPTSQALASDDCASAGGSSYASFANNAFVGFGAPTNSCSTGKGITALEQHVNSVSTGAASGNTRIDSSCAGDTGNPSCGTVAACATAGSACFTQVLTKWDDPSGGVKDLLDPSASWQLVAKPPCLVSQVDSERAAPVDVDFTGAARTIPPFSAGAYQSAASCLSLP